MILATPALTALLALGAAGGSHREFLFEGSAVPPLDVVESTAEGPLGLVDYRGRVLLICPSFPDGNHGGDGLPEINEYHQKFASEGLESLVLMPSRVDREVGEAWARRWEVEAPFLYCSNESIFRYSGKSGDLILVDAFGVVRFVSDPFLGAAKGLKKSALKKLLGQAFDRPLHAWPEEAEALAGAVRSGVVTSMLEAAEGHASRALAEQVADYAEELVDVRLEQIEGLLEDRQVILVQELFEQARVELAGSDGWDELLKLEREFEHDSELLRAREDYARLEHLSDALPSEGGAATFTEDQAKDWVKELRKIIRRNRGTLPERYAHTIIHRWEQEAARARSAGR